MTQIDPFSTTTTPPPLPKKQNKKTKRKKQTGEKNSFTSSKTMNTFFSHFTDRKHGTFYHIVLHFSIHLLNFSTTLFCCFNDVKIMYALREFNITSIGRVLIHHASISYRSLGVGGGRGEKGVYTAMVVVLFIFFLPKGDNLIGPSPIF